MYFLYRIKRKIYTQKNANVVIKHKYVINNLKF